MFTFPYAQYEDEFGDPLWMPHVSITLNHNNNEVDVFPALLDTGATHTVLPMSFATDLGFTIHRDEFIAVRTANGIGRNLSLINSSDVYAN